MPEEMMPQGVSDGSLRFAGEVDGLWLRRLSSGEVVLQTRDGERMWRATDSVERGMTAAQLACLQDDACAGWNARQLLEDFCRDTPWQPRPLSTDDLVQ